MPENRRTPNESEFDPPESLEKRNLIQDAYGTHPRAWFRWVSDRMDFPPGSRLLDLGSGDGSFWLDARDRLPPVLRLIAADLEVPMVKRSAGNLGSLTQAAGFLVLDAQALPFSAGCFEGVVALGLFDLVSDLDQALHEVRRVLKPGGCLVCSAGGRNHLREMEALVRPFVPGAELGGSPERFGLENGEDLLGRFFSPVRMLLYKDELVFHRAEPVVAYLLSEQGINQSLTEQERQHLVALIKQKLVRARTLNVSREKGLFLAWKPA